MSGSTAPLYSYPTASMSSHSTYAGPSVGESNYLASSSSGFPSNQFTQPGPSQGETTPGSKRPFPWASGSSSQERDKRARGSFTAPEEDGEDSMSTDESAYASAAESPQFNPRSPTRVDTPRSMLAAVDEHDTSHVNSSGTSVPRIPTPAALRSSSPLALGLLDSSSSTTSRPTQPLPSRVSLSIHALAESRNSSRYDIPNSGQEQPRQLDLGWLNQQLDEALPPPRSLEPFSSTQSLEPYSTRSLEQFSSTRSLEPFSSTRPAEPFASTRLEPVSSSTPDPVPTHPTRAFSTSYGSGSVDSALPLSRTAPGRVPLPWVDIENEGLSTPDGAASHQLESPDLGASSPSLGGTMSPSLGGAASAVFDGTVSPSLGGTMSPSLGAASPALELSEPDLGQSLASTFGISSPEVVESVVHSESGWDAAGVSGSSGIVASDSSVAGTSTSPSTIGASILPPTGPLNTPLRAGPSNAPLRVAPTSTPSRPAPAPAVSPSTSGSSASTRTTPQGPSRRPLSLNLHLRGFPTYSSGTSPTIPRANSPTFSLANPPFPRANSPTFSLANSPTFSLANSPTFTLANPFPTSASPRTSTFDLAVTPPGSALPSFVARMMEVDSPVRDTGGDGTGHAYTLLGSPSENNTASIDALRRFVENEPDEGRDSLGASPIQALADVAVGSYFPSPESERQDYLGQPPRPAPPYTRGEPVQVVLQGGSNQHGAGATESSGVTHPTGPSEVTHSTSPSEVAHTTDPSGATHPADPSWTSRPSDLDSVYSRRLTESGVSFPSRPSDSGASLPSFRAAVSPEPSLNMGSRPGRVVRDMSWSFSDLFRPNEGSGDDGRPTSSRPLSSEMPSGSGSETSLRTRVDSEGRASVRNALTRAVGLARADGPPRLHLNALPRMTGGLEQQDEQRSTNLSRTPPALGPTSHAAPSLSETWFEESARPRQSLGRRTSATRWTDLLPEPTPVSRPRMPPISTDISYDSLNGTSWDRNSVPYIDSSLSTAQTPQDSAAALARYQTFAQSIEEIRRSPSQLYSNQRNSAISSTATTGLNSGRTSATLGLDETSARTSWAPRREPVPLNQPQRTRNPYGNPYALADNHHPPAPPRPLSESFESRPADGNWLREWEAQRDRRSRAAREDYFRRRNTTSSNNSTPNVELGPPESSRRPHPLTQLNDQTQGQMWAEFNPRPRPMTRASLVATGFGDDDLNSEWSGNNQIFPPPRRPEILPPRADDADPSMRFSGGADDDGMGGMLFTDSPPSMLEEPEESPYELSNLPFPQSTGPSDYDPSDFRNAGHELRTSLAEAFRRGPDPPRDTTGSLGRRSLEVGAPMRDQPERTRLAPARDRWDSPTARPYLHLERVRQILRSGESREEPRRHPSDLGNSFLSGIESSSAFSSESTSSMRRSSMPWARTEPASAIETHAPRPFPPRESDSTEWPSTEASSRNSTLTHELLRASSVRRRRRTLLPESSSRRDSHGFLNSVNNALHQVESGLLHINRELNALANDEPSTAPSARMDWAYDQIEHRPPTPPPRLPPFNFSSLQQNSDWPASRRNQHEPEPEPPRRAPDGYLESRQNARNYDYSWRNEGLTSEVWSNDATGPGMPLRDRLLFRASAHPAPNRSNSIGSAFPPQAPPPAPPTFARLHRRRPSPPAPSSSASTSTAASLLRPFSSQTTSTSPPTQRSYTSRLSHLLPRRTSGRAGGGAGSSDDNDDWHHPAVDQSSTRRFFIRARGRATRGGPIPSGDFMRDEEFDDSYEGLLRLAARIGDAKPRGTPAEVIRSMPCCSYAEATGAEKETRCPICLDDYAQEDVVSMIKQCTHWFHRECIQQWLSNSRTCPVCRGQADGEGESSPEPRAGPSSGVPENHWM